MFLLKEFQFVTSLKFWWSMVVTACHAPMPMTSQIYFRSNYDVKMTSSRRHSAKVHSRTFDNFVIVMVTGL